MPPTLSGEDDAILQQVHLSSVFTPGTIILSNTIEMHADLPQP